MDKVLSVAVFFMGLSVLLCLIRVIIGPTKGDRMIGINVIATKTLVMIVMIAFLMKASYFVDVALVYALIGFVASVVVSREISGGGNRE